jgi:hypothetical protein
VANNGTADSIIAKAKQPGGSGKTPVAGRPGSPQYSRQVLGTMKTPEVKPRGRSVVLQHGADNHAAVSGLFAKPKPAPKSK